MADQCSSSFYGIYGRNINHKRAEQCESQAALTRVPRGEGPLSSWFGSGARWRTKPKDLRRKRERKNGHNSEIVGARREQSLENIKIK